eukprot:562620-Prorocentrum_minimum.AAC.1
MSKADGRYWARPSGFNSPACAGSSDTCAKKRITNMFHRNNSEHRLRLWPSGFNSPACAGSPDTWHHKQPV